MRLAYRRRRVCTAMSHHPLRASPRIHPNIAPGVIGGGPPLGTGDRHKVADPNHVRKSLVQIGQQTAWLSRKSASSRC